ncbi:hypothetical protein GC173_07960 [bacterium]|nr:hypothetical protein [bacterium]
MIPLLLTTGMGHAEIAEANAVENGSVALSASHTTPKDSPEAPVAMGVDSSVYPLSGCAQAVLFQVEFQGCNQVTLFSAGTGNASNWIIE